jgi:phage terminase large subunit GpA-like protein
LIVGSEEHPLQRTKCYTIDLTKIDGKGEFRCPRCGTQMSPDDETENVYTILETTTKKDCLEKIILQCNKCGSQIHLVGFDSLDEAR